jgi:hypothetical protein
MTEEKLDQGGLNVGSWVQKNRFAGLFKEKVVNRLKGYRNEQILSKVYKEHFINKQDKKDAIILAAAPKSGSTWVRFIFGNIIALQEMDGKVVDYHELDEMLPNEAWGEDMCKPWTYKTIPCIVRTHTPYKKIYDHFRGLFVYRNPLDTMVSQYHYITTRTADPALENNYRNWKDVEEIRIITEEWEKRGPGKYIRHSIGLDRWCHYFNSWIDNCNASCSYELLKSVPETTFKAVIDRLSLQVEDEITEEAIKRSDFKKVQTLEEEFGKSHRMAQLSTKFTRKGRVGQWKDYFDKSDISYFKTKMTEYNIDISRFEYGGTL